MVWTRWQAQQQVTTAPGPSTESAADTNQQRASNEESVEGDDLVRKTMRGKWCVVRPDA